MPQSKLIASEADVTEITRAAMANTLNPRLRQIMDAFVRHAHDFVREVNLTEEEFEYGLRFLACIGQANTDLHNEVTLAADVLGISTLVALRNNPCNNGQTASALLGPFWRQHAPHCKNGDTIARSNTSEDPLLVSGQVRNINGQPIVGAVVDVWQASPVGLYENQDPNQEVMNLRGKFTTDSEGRFHFRTVRPAGYPVPTDGPIGELLRAQRRNPYRPAHIHFMVSAPDHKTLITQVFADGDDALANDVVFGVTEPLVGNLQHLDSTSSSTSVSSCMSLRDSSGWMLRYDFTLQPGTQSFPEPPIK
jgi:protocatechuate 3,4-dioxygenase beta subunit